MSNLAEDLVVFLSHTSGLPSDSYCSILHGQRKILRSNYKADQDNLTIGDDVELMINELSQLDSIQTFESSSLSIFHPDIYNTGGKFEDEFEDIREEIKCIRKSDTLAIAYKRFRKPWYLHIFLCLLCVIVVEYSQASGPPLQGSFVNIFAYIVFLLDVTWLSYHFLLFTRSQLYFSVSIFNIYNNNNLYSRSKYKLKTILKLFCEKIGLLFAFLIFFTFYFIFIIYSLYGIYTTIFSLPMEEQTYVSMKNDAFSILTLLIWYFFYLICLPFVEAFWDFVFDRICGFLFTFIRLTFKRLRTLFLKCVLQILKFACFNFTHIRQYFQVEKSNNTYLV